MTSASGPDDRRWGDLVLWGPFAPVSAADLDRVEGVVGHRLPPDYREFLTVAHGGTLPYAVRLPPGDTDGDLIQFSTLFTGTGEGPETLLGEWRPQASAPLLPVAQDGGGSTLLLDLRDGSVWAFVRGLPTWAGGSGQDRGGQVAGSWTRYLGMLVVDEDMAQEVWEDARNGAGPEWSASVRRWLDAGLPGWRARPWARDAD